MTTYAFKDNGDGYYQVDVPDGQPMPDWTANLTPCAVQVVTPTVAQLISEFEQAVQNALDALAVSWNYESILSAASYANSTVTQFKNEALTLIAWRDQIWSACYAAEAAIQSGTQAMPASPTAFVATLPAAPARPT